MYDKLSQSGDKILSSPITKNVIIKVFYSLFIQTKINKQTEQNKNVVKCMKVFNLPVGRSNSKSCQLHAAHASFTFIMLFLSLWRVTLQKCQEY